jgi:hypothetical protein
MTKDRLEWIMSGIDGGKGLNKLEKKFIERIRGKIEQPEKITSFEERQLEQIYRTRSR